jgi:hypothetical protein
MLHDDSNSRGEVICDVIWSRRKLAVAPSPARPDQDGAQAGPAGHFGVPRLITNHP